MNSVEMTVTCTPDLTIWDFFGGRPVCQISDVVTSFGIYLVLGYCG